MIRINIFACLTLFTIILSVPAAPHSYNSNGKSNDYDMHELGKLMIDSHSSQFITEPRECQFVHSLSL